MVLEVLGEVAALALKSRISTNQENDAPLKFTEAYLICLKLLRVLNLLVSSGIFRVYKYFSV